MPIDDVNYASLRAMSFARTISKDITVIHIATDTKRAEKIQEKMRTYAPDLKLVIVESPLRAFMRPLLTYVDFHHRQHPRVLSLLSCRNSLQHTGGKSSCITGPRNI